MIRPLTESRAYTTLDIADVDVHEPYRKHGLFSALLIECEVAARLLDRGAVYVECISNQIVIDALSRRGYVLVQNTAPDVHMFKPVKHRDIGA
ncbi:hypothetical protein [Burkholderia sp. LMG 32019]|uniref:hypothetical protein n=1 Tax=Burkholderia sp. LMG 32019 TaxID=3158173 RepID=UPI003C2F2C7C